ncbi:unnamed protein product [Caenorhabditis angaria]|uniref:Membralin n=1 Tax=Caenorhabditis angaria TaxID=860376 RepID=A0A9P1MV65_9PELO|nr:unnamed protein product [Caenorhabditis angaria]
MMSDENDLEVNIDVNLPFGIENQVGNVEIADRPLNPPPAPPPPVNNPTTAAQNQQNAQNQFGNVRDRLFHAMLVRIAIKYSSKVNLTCRRIIESVILFVALILLCSLLFVHIKFTKTSITCLDNVKKEWMTDGILRVEVIKNLKMLEKEEDYIRWYVREKSSRSCYLRVADIFKIGPRVIPAEIRAQGIMDAARQISIDHKNKYTVKPFADGGGLLSYFIRAPSALFSLETDDDEKDERLHRGNDPLEEEAIFAWRSQFNAHYSNDDDYEYVYRVEYAQLYGVLRLPEQFREKHGIPTVWMRIDSKSSCFGDSVSHLMMNSFVGYEDAVISALREKAINASTDTESNSRGYLHDLLTHEHYHLMGSFLGKSSYLTAAILMLIFTFAISMLLRFSHHQIFVFIIDLLHMFELQQPLHFPVAPIFTVILALVGMEAIMSEVFNDTTTAFYVILIVWVADQYDAICCHSPVSKRFWLRFFYVYQYFFYAYQYRFGGQYGTLALWTSATFILHSMIYFFHHHEMPLILYQDRLQQVLADLHAPQSGMGTVEVQTITVAVHSRPDSLATNETAQQNVENREPLSPSSVFDARGPVLIPESVQDEQMEQVVVEEEEDSRIPEEIVARGIVNDAMNELFNTNNTE